MSETRPMAGKAVLAACAGAAFLLGGSVDSLAKPQGALIPVQQERCEAKFLSLDTDQDGRLSLEELEGISVDAGAAVKQTFRSRDANGDGFLTRGEFCGRLGSRKPARAVPKKPDDAP